MNKTEIRAELDKRGIVYNANLGVEKLQLILDEVVNKEGATGPVEPAPVEPAPVEPAPVEPAPVEPAPVEPTPVEPAPSIVKIIDRFGMVCRTYSLEEHGEGYVDLAKQFAAKKGLSIR